MPYWLLNPVAVVLPWVELVCRLFLVIGSLRGLPWSLSELLLVLFNSMVLINMYWGAPISCGCYDTVGEPIGWMKILENILLLIFTIHVSILTDSSNFAGEAGPIRQKSLSLLLMFHDRGLAWK